MKTKCFGGSFTVLQIYVLQLPLVPKEAALNLNVDLGTRLFFIIELAVGILEAID